MITHLDPRLENLLRNLEDILALIPNKDSELDFDELSTKFFEQLRNGIGSVGGVELVYLQLSKYHPQLNWSFRLSAATLLQDNSKNLNMATRVYISDLIRASPVKKTSQRSTLVRDVLIIWALMILRELGNNPTVNESIENGHTGSQIIFDHLEKRGLIFAKNAKTIEKRWTERKAIFDKIELGHLV